MKKKFTYKDIFYKSKRVALLGLAIVLAAGVYLTSSLNDEIPVHDGDVLVDSLAVKQETPQESTFEERRAELDLERNKLIASLDKTISNSKNDAEVKNSSDEKTRILDNMEKEITIESIIKSKNLPDTFVVISESGITATVDLQELDNNTVAKICDILMRETGMKAEKIVIQSKY